MRAYVLFREYRLIFIEQCSSNNGRESVHRFSTLHLILDILRLQVNAILYYAPTIFQNLGLEGNKLSLLATGVVGIVYVLSFNVFRVHILMPCDSMFIATIPAVIWVDNTGRKPILVSGAFIMAG